MISILNRIAQYPIVSKRNILLDWVTIDYGPFLLSSHIIYKQLQITYEVGFADTGVSQEDNFKDKVIWFRIHAVLDYIYPLCYYKGAILLELCVVLKRVDIKGYVLRLQVFTGFLYFFIFFVFQRNSPL